MTATPHKSAGGLTYCADMPFNTSAEQGLVVGCMAAWFLVLLSRVLEALFSRRKRAAEMRVNW